MTADSSHLLVVDDDVTFRSVLGRELERLGYRITPAGSGAEALQQLGQREPSVVLLDLQLPDTNGLDVLKSIRDRHPGVDVIMLTGHGSIDTAIDSIRAGAFDYVAKPCPLDELEVRIARALERQALQQRTSLLERGLTPPDVASGFVGRSAPFRQLLQLVERVAPASSTALIAGETGAGKEMVAKLLHARSRRRDRPFVVVECAALQETLLQSELFGHERGAFTGADRAKPGLFEVAHGGTIFLDEIGEVSLATQVKLLRVLDTSTFRRIGGTTEIKVDVRVIAATNRDLPAMVAQSMFRDDLYYRLSTITLRVPPLRERPDDIPMLAAHFVRVLNDRFGLNRALSAPAMDVLQRHTWPGNVRELLHVVEAAMIVCDGAEILPAHLSVRAPLVPARDAEPPAEAPTAAAFQSLDALERTHIAAVLRSTNGHRAAAARILGISERNLYRKLRDHHLLEPA